MPKFRYEDRPRCETPGCSSLCHIQQDHHNGFANYRRVCGHCHNKKLAKNKGISLREFRNSMHTYLKYRKDYCENQDSRLGYTCTTTVFWTGMLDVDHINGDSSDNRSENLQTLCKCCHAYKTSMNRDWASPGRKAIKMLRAA